MIFKRLTCVFLLAVLCFTFSGCARYSAVALRDFSTYRMPLTDPSLVASTDVSQLSNQAEGNFVAKSGQKGGVQMFAKIFDRQDCERYLGRDVLAKGYQPVHIVLKNLSSRAYAVAPERINLPLASVEEVAKSVHTSTAKRVTYYGIAGLFLSPFLIPAVVDGIKSSEANKELDRDYARKALKSETLMPQSQISALIFVPIERFNYGADISMKLVDLENYKSLDLIAQPPL